MKNYKIAAALLIIHGGFMEIAGVLASATLVLILIQYFEKTSLVKE